MTRQVDRDRLARRAERRGREALIAYIEAGSYKEAAFQLGIAESTLRDRIGVYVRQGGFQTIAQAAYHLDRVSP